MPKTQTNTREEEQKRSGDRKEGPAAAQASSEGSDGAEGAGPRTGVSGPTRRAGGLCVEGRRGALMVL